MMAAKNNERTDLIEDLEKERNSKIIVYFTGDRYPFGSRIAEDAVRPLYEHLINLDLQNSPKVIELFLYSRGGSASVPWRIVSVIREFCDQFNVLVPYNAQSAATLIALGADSIMMGRKAELGPIDPTLVKTTIGAGALSGEEISVEDVHSFLSFVKERANINDQAALASVVGTLINQIGPLVIGKVNREKSQTRLVARKLLTSRREKMDEEKINTIIETLTEKIYSHGHSISRKEASDIGLPVVHLDGDQEKKVWDLYLAYEEFLALTEPIHPEIELETEERKIIPNLPVAVIESVKKQHTHRTKILLEKTRNVPASPQINVNINLQFPANIQPAQIPQQAQQLLQQLLGQVGQALPGLIQQEMLKQSPVTGIHVRSYGFKWVCER